MVAVRKEEPAELCTVHLLPVLLLVTSSLHGQVCPANRSDRHARPHTPVPQMSVIEEKLRELDDERKELAEYTRLDKQRRYVLWGFEG